jgi:hypothetical protein
MSLTQKMVAFWVFLLTTDFGEFGFNPACFKKAEELELSEQHMNAVIGCWACTLKTEFPRVLVRNYNLEVSQIPLNFVIPKTSEHV